VALRGDGVIEAGDSLDALLERLRSKRVRGYAVMWVPLPTDRSQAWFWTEDWQAGEREASEQARRGEGQTFETGADFLDSLR
jgi:hypothetical protein